MNTERIPEQVWMRSIPIIFTFWPGLPQLWLYGRWTGLVKAVVFAAFLNFVLTATYLQTGLISKNSLVGCWMAVGLLWTLAIFRNDRAVKKAQQQDVPEDSAERNELFALAQSEYLRGHLDEAENLLERVIWLEPADLDARLYLATIYRHRGRLHQSGKQLDLMEKFEQASKWQFQIADERKMLAELEEELRGPDSDSGWQETDREEILGDAEAPDSPSRIAA